MNGRLVREQKLAVRRQVQAARDALDAAEREVKSAAICRTIAGLPEFEQAESVMLFASFGSELSTRALVDTTLLAGKRLVLPAVQGRGRLALRVVCDPATELARGTWGIPEPCVRCPEISVGELDFLLVPGLAFDERGGRVGYGGGYYDCLLRQMVARPRPPAIVAACFELQLLPTAPTSAHDLPVPIIVTEARVIRTGAEA